MVLWVRTLKIINIFILFVICVGELPVYSKMLRYNFFIYFRYNFLTRVTKNFSYIWVGVNKDEISTRVHHA